MSNYCWVFVTLVSLSHFDQLRPKLKKMFSSQMQVVILTSGIAAGRMGLEAGTLHGLGNLVQLHHVTRDRHGITPQGPVRATCFY